MNRENAKKLLPIITAFAEGKVIERKDSDGLWLVLNSPAFTNDPENYRIKPEPKEIWVNEYPDGYCIGYSEVREALRVEWGYPARKAVRYREVL